MMFTRFGLSAIGVTLHQLMGGGIVKSKTITLGTAPNPTSSIYCRTFNFSEGSVPLKITTKSNATAYGAIAPGVCQKKLLATSWFTFSFCIFAVCSFSSGDIISGRSSSSKAITPQSIPPYFFLSSSASAASAFIADPHGYFPPTPNPRTSRPHNNTAVIPDFPHSGAKIQPTIPRKAIEVVTSMAACTPIASHTKPIVH
mmetsp:Transcript_30748/g.70360  ORF Transcript_30748/g.70360 Transcript_30748/m.70360 type:complete len:200 (+) Transcript_30748:1201-1800(+)